MDSYFFLVLQGSKFLETVSVKYVSVHCSMAETWGLPPRSVLATLDLDEMCRAGGSPNRYGR